MKHTHEKKSMFVGVHLIKVLNRGSRVTKVQITDKDFGGSGSAFNRSDAALLARVLAYFAEHGTLPEKEGER